MIKISFKGIPGFNVMASMLAHKPRLVILAACCLAIVLGFLAFTGVKETKNIKKSLIASDLSKAKNSPEDKDVGVLVGSVDTKTYVSRIEKQYYDIASRQDSSEAHLGQLEKDIAILRKNQSEVSKIVMDLDKRVTIALSESMNLGKSGSQENQEGSGEGILGNSLSGITPVKPAMRLEMAKVNEINEEANAEKKRYVYLPLGSFVKGTLLTGVYAPVNVNNPLPVLISVDEAFYGPNNTRVPLKGAFAIGKAIGDVVSKRAIIQIVGFSIVLPGGNTFEHEGNLGYLTDETGRLGIPGELIYNTGKQLSLSFLSGFLAGGAEALSQAQTTSVVGAYGQTSQNVTGNTGNYAMFSGLANSAQGMASYYQKQLEAMIPAIKIEAGTKVTLVIQKGVEIEGLKASVDDFDYVD
ncbi:IncF plasmid conjugative transfer pilus assembly protein TraB [Candidatus Velamenicoccus archaeovorus]|uniref:IncF plasmid conjugative transfer pilus assembly protein TraB n=1 Tax=Velamenicoccus archaeovorus TaxID=1930593 RepID=A0A410P3D7_VELA1|nr:TraB/VirB10 family protein [Candidatus Velamenicoccus archaeovorus]QAT16679.1 IncF plasmid conjugative transfer pilus assembly protein TraB [Candidatus Velamenicoccus archaeovorus]